MRSRRRSSTGVRTWCAVATAAVVAISCGIPVDDGPRVIAGPTSTSAPAATEVAPGANATGYLFFIVNNQLISLHEVVPSSRPRDVLRALVEGVPRQAPPDVISQIPTGTRLLGVRLAGGVLDVDVSSEFDNVIGPGRTQAVAQIVMTATDLSDVDRVALSIDGTPTQVFSPLNGDAERVGACDYLSLMPTDDVIDSLSLDRISARHLTTRRTMLATQCGAVPTTSG